MTAAIKSWLRLPVAWLSTALLRISGRKVGGAIVYHRVGDPPPSGDPLNLTIPSRFFEAQLRHLQRWYRPVRARELQDAVRSRRRGQRIPIAVTFDDDTPSHVRAAMPLLERQGVTAAFFVCGASIDGPASFWWERLERAVDEGVMREAEIRDMVSGRGQAAHSSRATELPAITAAFRLLPPRERDAVADELGRRLGSDPPSAGMRAVDLRTLASAGFEIGFHTLRHYNLTTLDERELTTAMTKGRERIESVIGRELESIAYPHGKWDKRVTAAARRAGYQHGFTTDAEAVSPETDPLAMGRLDPFWCTTLGHFALGVSRLMR